MAQVQITKTNNNITRVTIDNTSYYFNKDVLLSNSGNAIYIKNEMIDLSIDYEDIVDKLGSSTASEYLITILDLNYFKKGGGGIAELSSGWADYIDTQYTSGSPLALAADTNTLLPNNRGTIRDNQKPSDITEFVNSSGEITGLNGDAYLITIEFKVVPTNVNTTYLDVWFDIGGAVGELYRRPVSFPKGNGIERPVTFSTGVYTLDTWEANSATVNVRANGTANIYDIRFVIYRLHKAV